MDFWFGGGDLGGDGFGVEFGVGVVCIRFRARWFCCMQSGLVVETRGILEVVLVLVLGFAVLFLFFFDELDEFSVVVIVVTEIGKYCLSCKMKHPGVYLILFTFDCCGLLY